MKICYSVGKFYVNKIAAEGDECHLEKKLIITSNKEMSPDEETKFWDVRTTHGI